MYSFRQARTKKQRWCRANMTWIALTTAPTIPSHITLKSSHSQNMCPSICKCECVCLGGLEMSTVLLVSKRYTSYARGVLSTPRRHAKSAAGSWTILAWSFTSFSESDTLQVGQTQSAFHAHSVCSIACLHAPTAAGTGLTIGSCNSKIALKRLSSCKRTLD